MAITTSPPTLLDTLRGSSGAAATQCEESTVGSILSDLKCQFVCCSKDVYLPKRSQSFPDTAGDDQIDGKQAAGEPTCDDADETANRPTTVLQRFMCCHTSMHTA